MAQSTAIPDVRRNQEFESTTVLEKELDDAGAKFKSIDETALPAINSALQGKKQEPIKAMSREDWDKKQK